MFIFGTNKGLLGFNDTRTSITNSNTILFKSEKDGNNFLSEIINKYCSVMFLGGSRKIVTRDLISIKIWDMSNNKMPITEFPIDDTIKSHLCDLFEADSLEDKFSLSNANGGILTGNYGDSFHLIEADSGKNMQYELNYSK